MTTLPFFTQLQAVCELAGWKAWIEPPEEGSLLAVMYVLVHVDGQGRNYLIRLVTDPQTLAEGAEPSGTHLVDMVLILPFQVQAAAVPDTTRLINAINLAGLIGSLALHEADRVVLLRFAWHVPVADMNPSHAYPLLQMMAYHARECAPGIEQVAQGVVGYEELLAAVGQEIQKVQPDRVAS
jgi:hypothetical protein